MHSGARSNFSLTVPAARLTLLHKKPHLRGLSHEIAATLLPRKDRGRISPEEVGLTHASL
ncbi:MAG: hypothetical protein RLZZ19_190 [Actinomycetota bacterium]